MSDRALIGTGGVGATIAAICCVTPIPAIVLGALGLSTWLSKADYVLFPALFGFLGVLGAGLYRRRLASQACCEPSVSKQTSEP
jgi:mercuric ion transport protein